MMTLQFRQDNGPADKAIEQLMQMVGGISHPGYTREMIIAVLKAGQETKRRASIKLMNSTMKELRFTEKIFGPYDDKRKVTVFGSARTRPHEPVYALARDFGRKLVESDFMVITGGGGGIMQAVNEGAGPEHSFGVNISLPFEQRPNPVLEGNPRLVTYKYFFNRKVAFVKEADAIALFPGGFGTLDEAMETLTLLQTGKHTPLPLVLIDEPGGTYWTRWIRFFREELLAEGYIGESDFDLFTRVTSLDEAIEIIQRFYRRYHSIRVVEDKLVIRLTMPLDGDMISQLNSGFKDLLTKGGTIVSSGSLPEEEDEPEFADLPRLVADFNQRDFGGLRRLIDAINNF